jgi:hypothetical protein
MMIKKIGTLIVGIACIMPAISAQNSNVWLEIKPGYFFFANHTLGKIYHGGFEIQGSLSCPIDRMIALYSSIGYLHVKGKSLGDNQRTTISQVPLDLGIRAIVDVADYAKSYLTIGPRFFYFHQRNDSTFVNRNIRRNGFGFFINGGCNFIHHERMFLGIFGEYGFQQKSFSSTIPNVNGRKDLQVGGFTFGLSLGFMF